MKTIRTAKLGKFELRLVEKDRHYFGVVVGDGARKAQIDGDDADDVWRRLHDEVRRSRILNTLASMERGTVFCTSSQTAFTPADTTARSAATR